MIDFLRSLSIGWWLLASLALSILSANLFWRLHTWREGRGRRIGAFVRRADISPLSGSASFLYNIGVPYAALLLGVLSPRLAGLTGLDWLDALGTGAIVALVTVSLLVLDRLYRRSLPPAPASAPLAPSTRPSALTTLWTVALQQAHWAFYRSGATVLFGAYNGPFIGLGLVVVEWLCSPAWRAAWTTPQHADEHAFDLALALTTTILFLLTGNLWVCAAVHAAVALTLGFSSQSTQARPEQSSPTSV